MEFIFHKEKRDTKSETNQTDKMCNVLELVDNFGFLISFFFDKFIC